MSRAAPVFVALCVAYAIVVSGAYLDYPIADLTLNTVITAPSFSYLIDVAPVTTGGSSLYVQRYGINSDSGGDGPPPEPAAAHTASSESLRRRPRAAALSDGDSHPVRTKFGVQSRGGGGGGVEFYREYGQSLMVSNSSGPFDALAPFFQSQPAQQSLLVMGANAAFLSLLATGGVRVLVTAETPSNQDDNLTSHLTLFTYDVPLPSAGTGFPVGGQTYRWIDDTTQPEPYYAPNGTLIRMFFPSAETSTVIGIPYGDRCYIAKWSKYPQVTRGENYYLLVRTEIFGSSKLMKYSSMTNALLWKALLVPKVSDMWGVIACDESYYTEDPITGDIFAAVDFSDHQQTALFKYWNITETADNAGATSALFWIDATTGNVRGIHTYPSALIRSQFTYLNTYSISVRDGVTYLAMAGRAIATNAARSLIVSITFSASPAPNGRFDTATETRAWLDIVPTHVSSVCAPATSAILLRDGAFLHSGEYVVTGTYGFDQVNTGSVIVGGQGFVAVIANVTALLSATPPPGESPKSMVRVLQFGVGSGTRDNSGGVIVASAEDPLASASSFVFTATVDRGLTHDAPALQYQHSAVFQTKNGSYPVRACHNTSEWWLCTRADNSAKCLEWCIEITSVSSILPPDPYSFSASTCAAPPIPPDPNPGGGGSDELSDNTIVAITVCGVIAAVIFAAGATRCYCKKCCRKPGATDYEDIDFERRAAAAGARPANTSNTYQQQL